MLRSRRNIGIVAVLVLLGVVLAAGCKANLAKREETKKSEARNEKPKELFTIRYPTLLFSDPVYIADELGFFKDEGIKVEFTGALPGADVVTSVATGSNDFAGTHASWITVGIAKGYKVKAVAAGWASTFENPSSAWLVLKDSPIKTPKDLVGKKVALSSPRIYTWLELLNRYGIPQDKVEPVVLPLDKQEQALRQGQVDAISVLNPFLTKALKGGGIRILATTPDVVGEEKGWPQQFVNTDFLKKNPEIVKGFVKALARATDWARENPEESGKIFAKRLDAPPEYADLYPAAYPKHALIDKADAQLWLDLAIKYGDVKEGQIKLSDIYTNEFNPYYKK